MKKRILMVAIMLFLLTGCKNTNESLKKTNYQLGTIITYDIYDKKDSKIIDEAILRVNEIENKMSINISNSALNIINEKAYKESVFIDDEIKEIILESLNISKQTGGLFDVTVGALVKLWDLNSDSPRVPSEIEIDSALKSVGYENIYIDDNNIKYKKENTIIDLGGIAKGYAADEVVEIFKKNDVKSAIINIGGNIYAIGRNINGELWKVGIREPIVNSNNYCLKLEIEDTSVVTSGYYERYFELNNKIYHHILNPFTGYPEENEVASVSVICKDSMLADALSTSLYLLGVDKGLEFIEKTEGAEAVFITKNKEVYVTKGLENKVQTTNSEYKIISRN